MILTLIHVFGLIMSLNRQQGMAVLLSLLLVFSTVAPAAAAPLRGDAWSGPPGDPTGDEGKENGQKAGNETGETGSNGEKNVSSGSEKSGKNEENGENGKNGKNGKQDESRAVDRPGRGPGNVGIVPEGYFTNASPVSRIAFRAVQIEIVVPGMFAVLLVPVFWFALVCRDETARREWVRQNLPEFLPDNET